MAIPGVWSNPGLTVLWLGSATVFANLVHTLAWVNDVTPFSGWTQSDLGILAGDPSTNSPWPWDTPVLDGDGRVYRTLPTYIEWDLSLFAPDTLIYGFTLGTGGGTGQQSYAERFEDGPFLVTGETQIIQFTPKLYLRNRDVSSPFPP